MRALCAALRPIRWKARNRRTRMRGSASIQPDEAHSRRTRSDSLLMGNGWETVLVLGKVLTRLSKP
jgi:hypothetical protein